MEILFVDSNYNYRDIVATFGKKVGDSNEYARSKRFDLPR